MPDLIGHSLGRYQILEQLGEGGMAIVYKAYDTRLEREVAVKIIRTERLTIETTPNALKRFEREAKALGKLTHPNIVPVSDYGENEGKPYLVMPYLPSGTLKQKMEKPIPWQEAIQLLLPIAEALDYAHSQNMIHRDVKPSNILLTQRGQPMLTDFGIAKILDLEETQDLTGTGVGIGTPEYMAPEQATSKAVDHRADIYSLGIVFYEMVTGRKPYIADTPMAVLIKHATEPLPRPKQFVPNLPDGVEQVLLKALAKKPEDRYQDMGEVVNALEKLQRDGGRQSVIAPKPASESKLTTRSKIPMMVLGSAALVLFAIFGLPPLMGKPEPTQQAGTAPKDTTTPKETATAMLTSTATPIHTPNSLARGEQLISCGTDICRADDKGTVISSLGLEAAFTNFRGFGWSKDKTRVVFTGCSLQDYLSNPNSECYSNIYVANLDGTNAVMLAKGDTSNSLEAPTWSPDDQWIVFGRSGAINIIYPDGTGEADLLKYNSAIAAAFATSWSPDSQQIATVGGSCEGKGGGCFSTRIFHINRDGSDFRVLYYSPDVEFKPEIAWSPDGKLVAVKLINGQAFTIDVACQSKGLGGCAEDSRTPISDIPVDWLPTFRPQWGGKKSSP